MRALTLLLILLAGPLFAQSSIVDPRDLELTVTVHETGHDPYVGEMVLVTIEGRYRRHITREFIDQPPLDGFSWMQLGEDYWFETTEAGLKVKNFRRRMALFPDRAGTLEIAPFVHRLTLLDETNKWFEHEIQSEPVTLEVIPKPAVDGWWLPVKRLEVSDQWSNAPDQLGEGEGVLRVIRVEALGVSPDLLPPMPELRSPSALIFPHPEKRLVDLSPEGPVAIAFWRWTVRPLTPPSAILEPIEFSYFDTTTREAHSVSITAQRLAFEDVTFEPVETVPPGELRTAAMAGSGAAAFGAGLLALLWQRRFSGWAVLRRRVGLHPLQREMRRAGRAGDAFGVRRLIGRMFGEGAIPETMAAEVRALDAAIFGEGRTPPDLRKLAGAAIGEFRRG